MSDFTNDPRLTAYALGELEGAERAEIEALVASDESAKRFVDDVRATAALVTTELATAGGPALTDAQRAAIAAKAQVSKPIPHARPTLRLQTWHWIAGAASVAAGIGGAVLLTGEGAWSAKNERSVATAPSPVKTVFRRSEQFYDESASAPAEPEVIDRNAIPKIKMAESQSGPINPDEVLLPSTSETLRRGEISDNADPSTDAGDEMESESPANVPSGATGGTSVGVGKAKTRTITSGAWNGHFAGRAGGGGAGGGGLGAPAKAPPPAPPKPRPAQPAEPNSGPQTPGGGSPGGPTLGDRPVAGDLFGSDVSTASYAHIEDNPFRLVKDAPLSTFGVDVDTASYSNIRRFLTSGQLPPPGAVRIEEMVNYFPYDYAPPSDGRPFAVRVDVAGCPWKTDHRLVRVGIKGKVVATSARPAANLVFLLDVSGSMSPQNRLPLILQSMKMLVGQLEARDRVAIVVYAGESGLALPSTSCEDKGKILAALDALHAGGSTNGASGIQLAYDVAAANKVDGGINRVILATDGDFNVGVTDESSLVKLVQEKAKAGTFLSVLGVGDDNFKDSTMEMLADRGNGNYAYIDTLKEGEKVLVQQTNGTLVTIAKDVKLQIEFNPAQVGSYRLIGYEDRVLAAEDFKDDKKDAGEIGAGHTVTALYEIVPSGATETSGVDPLKYQPPQTPAPAPATGTSRELLTVKLRWKEPNADVSTPMEVPVVDEGMSYSAASPDFKFAASVAAFGMVLRNSPNRGNISIPAIVELATEGAANDPGGYRAEFVGLLKTAAELGAK